MVLKGAATLLGSVYCANSTGHFTIAHNHEIKTYEILDTLPFSSDRKRMSVFAQLVKVDGVDVPGVKDDSAWVSLFCKGADDVILPRLEVELEEDVRIFVIYLLLFIFIIYLFIIIFFYNLFIYLFFFL